MKKKHKEEILRRLEQLERRVTALEGTRPQEKTKSIERALRDLVRRLEDEC